MAEPAARNDSAAFTGFLHRLTQCIDPRLNIRIVMDNGSSHTSRATRASIATRPRITITYTPKHASWLDMAELWFSVLTRGLLRRGEFTSRTDLIDRSSASRSATTSPPHPGLDLRARRPRAVLRPLQQPAPARTTAQPPPLKPSRRPHNSMNQPDPGDLRQTAAASRGVPAALARAFPQPIPG